MNRKNHWDSVYGTKGEKDVSWFEPLPEVSLRLMEAAGLNADTCVLDVGGGDSHLVDALIGRGLGCLAVLDVSGAALARAKRRLGTQAAAPVWIEADVTAEWSLKPMDIWHDRATFHFLVSRDERARYVDHLRRTLKVDGSAIIATFAQDGPEKCSGLPVSRYSPESLGAELGPEFRLVEAMSYEHKTPWGASQPFNYSRFLRTSDGPPLLMRKDTVAPSVFSPDTLVREAQRQKAMPTARVPRVCVLDPDGDVVRWLKRSGRAELSKVWPCYHSELYEFQLEEETMGIVGCAVGAPYAVLVAEQMFACGCELLISITSSGQVTRVAEPPYFVMVTHALRDEGTSYHYAPATKYAQGDARLIREARAALQGAEVAFVEGATWTTDAPFRETAQSVAAAEADGVLAVEMECAALYAFAKAAGRAVLCLAHVTNTMGRRDQEFEKGDAWGAKDALRLLAALRRLR